MRESEIKVSVIIPAYERCEHLIELIQALLKQTRPPHEIIVSHTSFHDPSKMLECFSSNVKIIHQDLPLFAGAARNKGAAAATGNWFAFFDEDVIPAPDCLERYIEALERYPERVLFAGSIDMATTGGYWGKCLWYIEFGSQHSYLKEYGANTMAGCNNFVMAKAFRAVGGYPDTIKIGEDAIFHLKVRKRFKSIMFIPSARVRHFNVSGFRYYVAHLGPLGRGAALVRSTFDTGERVLVKYPFLSFFLPFARSLLLLKRSFRKSNKGKWQLIVLLPGIFLGLCIWADSFFVQAENIRTEL